MFALNCTILAKKDLEGEEGHHYHAPHLNHETHTGKQIFFSTCFSIRIQRKSNEKLQLFPFWGEGSKQSSCPTTNVTASKASHFSNGALLVQIDNQHVMPRNVCQYEDMQHGSNKIQHSFVVSQKNSKTSNLERPFRPIQFVSHLTRFRAGPKFNVSSKKILNFSMRITQRALSLTNTCCSQEVAGLVVQNVSQLLQFLHPGNSASACRCGWIVSRTTDTTEVLTPHTEVVLFHSGNLYM